MRFGAAEDMDLDNASLLGISRWIYNWLLGEYPSRESGDEVEEPMLQGMFYRTSDLLF